MICFKCSKPFEEHRGSKRICEECFVEKGSRQAEVDRKRADYLKKRYGIEPEDYDYMLAAQNGCCAICGESSEKPLVVDHCHWHGGIRGLLCYRCNTGLGFFRDDQTYLRKAIAYLDRHARETERSLQIPGNK